MLARDDRLDALGEQPLERDVERVEDRDRGRPGRLALREEVSRAAEVEVEARHLRLIERLPASRPDRDHRQAGRHHPPLLRAGGDDVQVPGVDGAGERPEAADGVDEDEHVRPRSTAGVRERLQVVRDAGGGLVVGEEHGAILVLLQLPRDRLRLRCGTPLEAQPLHVRAVGLRDGGEAVAECADRDAQHAVAGRERVHDHCLHRAGARGAEDEHVVFGLEERLQPIGDALQHFGELRAAVVDHLAAHRLEHVVGAGRRAGDAQVHVHSIAPCRAGVCGAI